MTVEPVETEATNADVMQVEKLVAVPVGVEGIVRTHEMPAVGIGFGQYGLDATLSPVKILNRDPKRKQATIWSDTTNIYLGQSQGEAAGGSRGALWLANVPIVITAESELWAQAASSTTTVHTIVESWTQ